MKTFGIVLSLSLILAGAAHGSGCVVQSQAVHYQQQQVLATYYQPVQAVYVPTYSAGYNPGPAQESQELRELKEKFSLQQRQMDVLHVLMLQQAQQLKTAPPDADLRQRYDQLRAPPADPGPQKLTEGPGSLFFAACVKCHTANGKEKGKFVVANADGSLRTFDSVDIIRIAREVDSGRMPKGEKLDPEQLADRVKWFDSIEFK